MLSGVFGVLSHLESFNQNPELPKLTRPDPPDTGPQSFEATGQSHLTTLQDKQTRCCTKYASKVSLLVDFIELCWSDFDYYFATYIVDTYIEATFD